MGDLSELTAEDFEPCQGDAFVAVVDDGASLDLVLATVLRLGRHPPRRDAFSLLFHGPPTPIASDGIRHLGHPTLGGLDVFLVPIAADRDRVVYEAIFS